MSVLSILLMKHLTFHKLQISSVNTQQLIVIAGEIGCSGYYISTPQVRKEPVKRDEKGSVYTGQRSANYWGCTVTIHSTHDA